jgi:hypothetical protein
MINDYLILFNNAYKSMKRDQNIEEEQNAYYYRYKSQADI